MANNRVNVSVFLLILLLISQNLIFAQTTVQPGKPNELDNKFTPSQFPLFNGSSSTSSGSHSGSSYDEFKNVIKCNIGLLPRKIAAISYERFLAEEISIEGSVGFCYGKDPIFSAIGSEIASISSISNNQITLTDLCKYSTYINKGLFMSGSIKFHFSGFSFWNDEGTYLELGFRNMRNNLDITPLINQQYNSPNYNFSGSPFVSLRQTQYLICYGYRFATTEKIKTSHEFYFGAGWRSGTYNSFSFDYSQNSGTSEIYQNGSRENFSSPIFVMGYILGFGF